MVPAIGAIDVDPSIAQMRITFDMPMTPQGFSLVGEGPNFPSITGAPRWLDAYSCVVPVKLRADCEYRFTINGAGHNHFRSVWLVPAVPTPCHFKTGGMGRIARDADAQQRLNVESFDALADALRQRYAHIELRGLNWEQLLAEHRREVVGRPTTREWMHAAAEMLRAARDVNLCLEFDDEMVEPSEPSHDREGVVLHRPEPPPPVRLDVLAKYVPSVREINDALAAGVTPDDIAYVRIGTWSERAAPELAAVQTFLSEHRQARGVILDVRGNSGGAEELAKSVAAWFVTEKRVYAKHRFRRGPQPGDFTPLRERAIEPNPPERRYQGPVIVLIDSAVRGASEEFLLMMKQAERAELVGVPTAGASGRPTQTFLPNGVRVYIPTWQSMTPDGECFEGKGITPDIRVERPAEVSPDRDAILERALEHLREGPRP